MTQPISPTAVRDLLSHHATRYAQAMDRPTDLDDFAISITSVFENALSGTKPWEAFITGLRLGVTLAVAVINNPFENDPDAFAENFNDAHSEVESARDTVRTEAELIRQEIGADAFAQITVHLAKLSREGLEPVILGAALLDNPERD
jgi:hypothetical protein